MDYSTLAARIEQSHVSGETEALTLYEAFEQVKDGRKKRGVRYRLALILTLIVLAKSSRGNQFEWGEPVGTRAQRGTGEASASAQHALSVCGDLQLRLTTCGCRGGDQCDLSLFYPSRE